MTIYIGTPGRMVHLPNIGSQSMSTGEALSFQATLEGRVKAQRRPVARREWSLGATHYRPQELGALVAFANGDWGAGPFWFVSADAPVVNLLSPGAARSDVSHIRSGLGVQGGPWSVPEGLSARSVMNPDAGFLFFDTDVPVLANVPVTGSMIVQGSGRVRLAWYDVFGQSLGSSDSSTHSGSAARVVVTSVPPSGAVFVRLGVTSGITRLTRPAVTWTDQPFEWGDGQGCEKAVVLGVSRDLVKALRSSPKTGRWTNVGFSVQEVG